MSNTPKPSLQKVMLDALVIVLLAAVFGLAVNWRMVFNLFSGQVLSADVTAGEPVSREDAVLVELFPVPIAQDELDELLAEGALLIDARNSLSFADGHLPGALSLPYTGEAPELSGLDALADKGTTLITYCSGYGCEDSFKLGSLLMQVGYQDVVVYEGGLPEWQDSGRELEKVGQ
jgi:rhodanese-related sulfurtransferase